MRVLVGVEGFCSEVITLSLGLFTLSSADSISFSDILPHYNATRDSAVESVGILAELANSRHLGLRQHHSVGLHWVAALL